MPNKDDDWPTEADLRGMDPGERVVALAQWFRTRYAPPGSHATLADYDDWLDDERQPDDFATADRGPVEALDVLSEKFGGMLDEEFLQTVADILDRESTEWIRVPDGERSEEDYIIENEPNLTNEEFGLLSLANYTREDLRDAMPDDATPDEREQIERLLRELLVRLAKKDTDSEAALGDVRIAQALVLERVRSTREVGNRLRKRLGGSDDGLPTRKHNNPPADAAEILAAAQHEIFERGLEHDLREMEDNLRSEAPNAGRLTNSAKQILRWTANAALAVIRSVPGDVRAGAIGALVEDCLNQDPNKLLFHFQSLRIATKVLLSHLGVEL